MTTEDYVHEIKLIEFKLSYHSLGLIERTDMEAALYALLSSFVHHLRRNQEVTDEAA